MNIKHGKSHKTLKRQIFCGSEATPILVISLFTGLEAE